MTYKDHIRRFLKYLFWGLLIALVLLLFISWELSIYVDGVQGLLTTRGIRWMCVNIVPNFSSVHIAKLLLGLMAFSVLRASGILLAFHSHISLKQRRALQITGVSVVVVSLLLFLPDPILLSAFGTFQNSAFSKGFIGLLACLAIFIGNVYGYTSGRFTTLRDFMQAHASIFAAIPNYFVMLFLASQFVNSLNYTGILPLLGDDGTVFYLIKGFLYNGTLLLYILLTL